IARAHAAKINAQAAEIEAKAQVVRVEAVRVERVAASSVAEFDCRDKAYKEEPRFDSTVQDLKKKAAIQEGTLVLSAIERRVQEAAHEHEKARLSEEAEDLVCVRAQSRRRKN
ncbi:unnamed protein product, partial [marine sediment metagenome]